MNGLRKVWDKGPRTVVGNTDARGNFTPRAGKHGGPVVEQEVRLVLVPTTAKERRRS